jgi:hypothetical protein
MGIGYAWWNDTITIGGTAAVGNMNVHFENNGGFPFIDASKYVEPALLTTEDSSITCTFNKLYPGAIGILDVKAVNDSTLGVKFDAASINVTGDAEIISKMNSFVIFYKTDVNGNYVEDTYGWTNYVPLTQLADELNNNTLLQSIVFEPGETLYFGVPQGKEGPYDINNDGEKESCLVLHVDTAAGEEIENQSLDFTLNLGWKQFNQY